MRLVRQIMGMPISIDMPGARTETLFEAVFLRLTEIDNQFSTYKSDSEVSKYIRGEITKPSPELAEIIRRCEDAQRKTDGYFSAWAAGPFDPSGYVKGWAIEDAGRILEEHGVYTYCIGAGGDILARSDTDKVWNIGIQDPSQRTKILNKLSISNGAVATSGNYERGDHIINPKTKKPADELLSVTVTGPDIIGSDVLATASFAMGAASLQLIESKKRYEALLVDKTGKIYQTSGLNKYID